MAGIEEFDGSRWKIHQHCAHKGGGEGGRGGKRVGLKRMDVAQGGSGIEGFTEKDG